MRELTDMECSEVSGGLRVSEAFGEGAAIGTVFGYARTGTLVGATRAGIIGGLLGASFGAGWGVGTMIYRFASASRLAS